MEQLYGETTRHWQQSRKDELAHSVFSLPQSICGTLKRRLTRAVFVLLLFHSQDDGLNNAVRIKGTEKPQYDNGHTGDFPPVFSHKKHFRCCNAEQE